MKIFKTLTAVTALLITFGVAESAMAAVGTIYGPVYLSRNNTSKHHDGAVSTFSARGSKHHGDTVLTFSAPVPGKGVVVIKNGGDSGKKSRVNSAKIKLNGETIVEPRRFSNGHHGKFDKKFHKEHRRTHRHGDRVSEIKVEVDLLANNEMKVKIKSCKRCELEIYVMGEMTTTGGGGDGGGVKPSGR